MYDNITCVWFMLFPLMQAFQSNHKCTMMIKLGMYWISNSKSSWIWFNLHPQVQTENHGQNWDKITTLTQYLVFYNVSQIKGKRYGT